MHEFGHSIGLPHSGWVYYAYDTPWDDMGKGSAAQSVVCGTYKSANSGNAIRNINCTEPGSGYITIHKAQLGWLPTANQRIISAKTAAAGVNIVLTPNSGTLSGFKMIKICLAGFSCTGGAARFITVEGRVKSMQYERGLPFEGVIIHDVRMNRAPIGGTCFFNSQSGWAVPIDATPNDYNKAACNSGGRTWPNYALGNAQFGVGKTYTNTTLGVVVKVLSRSGNNFTVNVKRTK